MCISILVASATPCSCLGGCHEQTNTLHIFDAIACIFHETPLLPFFFFYRSSPKRKPPPLALYLA